MKSPGQRTGPSTAAVLVIVAVATCLLLISPGLVTCAYGLLPVGAGEEYRGPDSGPSPDPGGGISGEQPGRVPGELLVRFRGDVAQDAVARLVQELGAIILEEVSCADFELLKVPDAGLERALELLAASGLVELAERNYLRQASSWTPDDPLFSDQWNLKNGTGQGGVNMPGAWAVEPAAGDGVVVAVLDTGIAYQDRGYYRQAPDLSRTSFTAGYDFINSRVHADDDHGHGTHVAGTVAQSTNNGIGVAGIAFNATLMPVKVLDSHGTGSDSQVIRGIRFAADNGAQVINMSLGGKGYSRFLEEAVNYAHSRGVLLVAASGNNGAASVEYPAAFDSCMAVGATTVRSTRADYSNYGSELDLVAPGGESRSQGTAIVQNTYRVDRNPQAGFGYIGKSGTSMACAHVSGVAAMVRGRHTSWSPDVVRAAILASCRDLGDPGWDPRFGYGLVDAQEALKAPGPLDPVIESVSPWFSAAGSSMPGVEISGKGFSRGAVVSLERPGESTIRAEKVAVQGSSLITCDFNLVSALPGPWDLVVENNTGSSTRLEGGFMVDPAGDTTWYFAEGTTAHGFEQFLTVQNPGPQESLVQLTFMTPAGPAEPLDIRVPAMSRATLRINDVLFETDVSIRAESSGNVICERSMYWGGRVEGTQSIGVQTPSKTWHLAEGSTAHGLETYLVIQNPGSETATVDVTYFTPRGPASRIPFMVPGGSRHTIDVSRDLPSSDFAISVEADRRVIAERSMYWDSRRGGHCSAGVPGPSEQWYLAEGSTDYGFETFLVLSNPGRERATARVTYMTYQGPVARPELEIPPHSRATVHVNSDMPWQDMAIEVAADRGLVVERSMYWDNGTGLAGHNSIGTPQPRHSCYLAEGSSAWGFDTWVLVQNPAGVPARLEVVYMTPHGPVHREPATLPPGSRVTLHLNAELPGTDASVRLQADVPVVVERAMYWNSRGAGHASHGMMR